MKSVLVFRSAALGDFVMAGPALVELRKKFLDCQVVLLTISSADRAQRSKVAKYSGGNTHMPWIQLAVPHLVDEVVVLQSVNDLSHLWKIRKQLQIYDFSAAILLLDPCAPWIGRIKKLLLIIFLVGFVPVLGWRWQGALRQDAKNALQLKQLGTLRHHVHGPLQFLSEISPPRKYNDADLVFDLRPGHDAVVWASTWLRESRLDDGKRLVALAPGSIQPHKRWPLESFKSLLVSLLSCYTDIHILVIGTPADKELGDVLTAIGLERVHNLAGITSIAQSAALLQQCQLLIGNDGGAMHLGDAMGCKVVSIVPGIEFPDSIEPWHNKELAVRHHVECSPCYNFVFCPKGHNRCMVEMPVARVLEKCISVLEKKCQRLSG